MFMISAQTVLDNLPQAQPDQSLNEFLKPLLAKMPEKRLEDVARDTLQGLIATQSPLVTQIACTLDRRKTTPHATNEWLYRFLGNERVGSSLIFEGLYQIAQERVAREQLEYIVVAVDRGVNKIRAKIHIFLTTI
jgi:hypothetical protein